MAVAMSTRAVKKVRAILGSRLRALRGQLGWTQRGLGRRAGLSGKFIGEVERGEKSITIDSLYLISRALRTPLDQLASMDGNRARAASVSNRLRPKRLRGTRSR
jgi:transcriptional regulator with XRE-family HTH domain